MQISDFDSIQLFTLENENGVQVKLTNYGARITSITVPDRTGDPADITLGYNSVEGYINAIERPYFGCVVGRFGNRIARGQFSLNGRQYELATNDKGNHLHGGLMGFDKMIWHAEPTGSDQVTFHHLSPDGDEGYPGNLNVSVAYHLSPDNALHMRYRATTDTPTPVNLTNHAYFNLSGEGTGSILDHELMINATHFTAVRDGLIPTGEIREVEGTPFDFRSPKPIGRDISLPDEQLHLGPGYDHNWVLDRNGSGLKLAARARDPKSGRTMEVWTTEPGIQFYTGNSLDGQLIGKSGRPYTHRSAFCLETQHFPDSPNHSHFPSTILYPGETYLSTTEYRFGITE